MTQSRCQSITKLLVSKGVHVVGVGDRSSSYTKDPLFVTQSLEAMIHIRKVISAELSGRRWNKNMDLE